MSRVCIMSLWRNDAYRSLESRVQHLSEKARHTTAHEVSYLWCVGDSSDTTYQSLLPYTLTHAPQQVRIVQSESGVGPGEDTPTRRRRFASNANDMFATIPDAVDYVLLHESDIQSPPDLVDRLFHHLSELRERSAVAAWPVMELDGVDVFYDIWAFRRLNGLHFKQSAKSRHPRMEVSSFGTVWMAPTHLVRNRTISEDCVVDLCAQWRREGVKLWTAADVVVRQPTALWTPTASA